MNQTRSEKMRVSARIFQYHTEKSYIYPSTRINANTRHENPVHHASFTSANGMIIQWGRRGVARQRLIKNGARKAVKINDTCRRLMVHSATHDLGFPIDDDRVPHLCPPFLNEPHGNELVRFLRRYQCCFNLQTTTKDRSTNGTPPGTFNNRPRVKCSRNIAKL